jgi:2,4-dienoyl-CoA reductase-like NADH-dependent reductase (Old Yellow Enzyme family)
MQEILQNGFADFISMSRPFIREPNIVNRIRKGQADAVACVSCNKCFAAIANLMPVKCYNKGIPK